MTTRAILLRRFTASIYHASSVKIFPLYRGGNHSTYDNYDYFAKKIYGFYLPRWVNWQSNLRSHVIILEQVKALTNFIT
jgi:hypothetical protein